MIPIRTHSKHQSRVTVILFFLIIVTGCSSLPLASVEEENIARQFQPPAEKAYIYVIREGRFVGNAANVNIVMKDKLAAQVGNDQYAMLETEPGKLSVKVGLESGRNIIINPSVVDLDIFPGKIYFLITKVIVNGVELTLVDKEEGKSFLTSHFNYKRVKPFSEQQQLEQSMLYCTSVSCSK